MNFLYFIAAHKNPDQVRRLASLVAESGSHRHVVVHYDAKSPAPNLSDIPRTIQFPKRSAIAWGDYSQISMFLDVAQWSLENVDFDWLIFLSGQDYPIRRLNDIEDGILASGVDVMLNAHPFNAHPAWRPQEGFDRYMFHYYDVPLLPYSYRYQKVVNGFQRLGKVVNHINPLIRFRWMPYGLRSKVGIRHFGVFKKTFTCHAGSQWGNFSRHGLEQLMAFTAEKPEVARHFARTLIPDESMFPTIFAHLARARKIHMLDDTRRYIHWHDETRDASPQVIVTHDFESILRSGKDFARKFDVQVDAAILDRIDAEIHGVDTHRPSPPESGHA